ncbi:type II and III secretion system protein family protein [Celeribacter litoreus]|uniref:type II and III secretion system protein family protein n=1 Tax=Celeribacter litoreus TaxID=2876714 RepID=UPI001CC8FF99|nr:type II and III secretion system protein family protein [Celeribacter litoreus]MCA0043920.1 type II and III secretion system protein family protein [Celeribacter litoreus]
MKQSLYEQISGLGRKLLLAVFFALPATTLVAETQTITIADGTFSTIELASGRTLNVQTDKPFKDILIGNTDILDVFPLTETSLYIQSKRNGATNISLYDEQKRLLEVIDVNVRADYSDLAMSIRQAVPSARVNVANVNNRIRLSGDVKNAVDVNRILQIASQYSEEPVINAMRVQDQQQVELDVRIIEVARNSGRSLGVNLTGYYPDGAVDSSGNPIDDVRFTTGAASSQVPFGVAVGELLEVSGMQVDFLINALEGNGLARRLANPKLVATSGVEANFVVGGEVPISVFNSDSDVYETTYREFGVRLNFLPEVLDEELIRLRITPEVSDIDASIDVNGQPGFITRRADTTVSLRSGQSFAIAGLLQANNERSINQVPWLGEVPILGALFKSTAFQKRETDLVILVTPRIVRPARPGEPLATPLDGTRSSNDVELFLLGMLEVDKKTIRGFRDGVGINGVYGHIIDLEFEDGVIAKK